jgi:multiple sugar transport system substrate-binding protein
MIHIALLAAVVGMAALASGCGQLKLAAIQAQTTEPITLTLYVQGASLSDDEFKTFFTDPLKKSHPNITLNVVRSGKQKLEDLLAAGTPPDLIFGSSRNLTPFLDLRLPANLYPLLKKHNADLTKYDPIALSAIKNYGSRGQLYALPIFENFSALYYNKDLFDKFKVPYPKDGMSWNDVIELARQMTFTVGEKKDKVQYKGINPDGIRNFASSLSIQAIDPITYRAVVVNNSWREVLSTYEEVMTIPGNAGGTAKSLFGETQTLAMYPGYLAKLNELEALFKKNKGINFDIVSYPYFKGSVGTGAEIDVQAMMITQASKHKEEAYWVIETVMTPEIQLAATRRARLSALNDPSMKIEFGTDYKSLKGKNVYGMFKVTPSIGPKHTPYDNIVNSKISTVANQLVKGIVDVDGALQQLQNDINAAIDEARGIASNSSDSDSSDNSGS